MDRTKVSRWPLDRERLLKFVQVRNASEFDSNLQVSIDLKSCLIDEHDITFIHVAPGIYKAVTPYGVIVEDQNIPYGVPATGPDQPARWRLE